MLESMTRDVVSQKRSQPIYLADLLDGLVAALVLKGIRVLPNKENRLDLALEKLFEDVQKESTANHLDVRFLIQTNPHNGDSEDVQEGLVAAAERRLVSLDNPEFQVVRFKVTPDQAATYLGGLPGTPDMYKRLAEQLLLYFRAA